jgi:hypothetical protein
MQTRFAAPLLSLLVLLAGSALGQSVLTLPPMTTITFTPGSTTSTLAGQVAPGGRNVYYVLAKAGQSLSVSVASTANAITFQVFPPEATLEKGADGVAVVTGRTLPDAGPSDNAKAWIGAIPRDGNYLILVSMSAGSASPPSPYNLTVSLQ